MVAGREVRETGPGRRVKRAFSITGRRGRCKTGANAGTWQGGYVRQMLTSIAAYRTVPKHGRKMRGLLMRETLLFRARSLKMATLAELVRQLPKGRRSRCVENPSSHFRLTKRCHIRSRAVKEGGGGSARYPPLTNAVPLGGATVLLD